jgi:hypothetical protein
MRSDFFDKYQALLHSAQGMSSLDAMLLFMAYGQLAAEGGVQGHALEIGVHHGVSAVAVSTLRGPAHRFVAIDLFEQQAQNTSHSGLGDREIFLANMARVHGSTDFVRVLARPSGELRPSDLGTTFAFSHVDGGHSCEETLSDLVLCDAVLMPGGLLGLDDYFNPNFPGVSEGASRFAMAFPGHLRPLAVGFNKVLFQKLPAPDDLNAKFRKVFPGVSVVPVTFWGQEAFLIAAELKSCFDLDASEPGRLVPASKAVLRAEYRLGQERLALAPGASTVLSVEVRNRSTVPLRWSDSPMGLSFHLLDRSGKVLVHDHRRTYFHEEIPPGAARPIELVVAAPAERGEYQIEIDIVWEGVTWFKERGSPTVRVPLTVS